MKEYVKKKLYNTNEISFLVGQKYFARIDEFQN